jgi:hypothetical protein
VNRKGVGDYLKADGIVYSGRNVGATVGGERIEMGVHEGVVNNVRVLFLHNATETFTQPTQADAAAAGADAPDAGRADCPHADPSLLRWEVDATWGAGAAAPTGGNANVTLPAGVSILLSSCSLPAGAAFGSIVVPAGARLVLADAALELRAASIVVRGALVAGAPACRLRSAVTITLTGARPGASPAADAASDARAKGILVEGGGTLDVHGAQFAPTWTRLAATAAPNDSWIFLQQAVNWDVGATVLVATTAVKDTVDYSESEEAVIAAAFTLPSGAAAIRLAAPLAHMHYAGREYQAEVALLSRRVTIQGAADDSPPTDAVGPVLCTPTPSAAAVFLRLPCGNWSLTGYGGHVMVSGAGATGRFSGVLLLRMGQTNYLGRYPVHFHLLNESGVRSFMQDSSVWRSYYRCASLHGTLGARLSRNVAHDVVGHCYYLEDGVEERNLLDFNLASRVRTLSGGTTFASAGPLESQEAPLDWPATSILLLPADVTASGFYITNSHNNFTGNAAIGGWSGFAFPNLPEPIGAYRGNTAMRPPYTRPSLAFVGNTAHSSGYYWASAGCLYTGGLLGYASRLAPTLSYNAGRAVSNKGCCGGVVNGQSRSFLQLNNTKLFLCNGANLQHWGFSPEINGLETADFGSKSINIFGLAVVNDWLVTCRTPNARFAIGGRPVGARNLEAAFSFGTGVVFQSYDVGQSHILNGVHQRNCSRNSQPPSFLNWQVLTHSDTFSPDAMIATRRVSYEGLGNDTSWLFTPTVNAQPLPTVSHRMQNWYDADGSLTGKGVPSIIGSARSGWWWRLDGSCANRSVDWTMLVCAAPPSRGIGSMFLGINLTAQSAPLLGGSLCSNGGWDRIPCPSIGSIHHLGYPADSAHAMDVPLNAKITGPTGGFGWVLGGAWRPPRVLNISGIQIAPETVQLLVLPYPPGSTFRVTMDFAGAAFFGSWCSRPPAILCTHAFSRAASVAAVRAGAGDTYFFDDVEGYLYVRLTTHGTGFWPYVFLGVPNASSPGGRQWGVPTVFDPSVRWSRAGITLPPRGANVLRIEAVCGGAGVDASGAFCAETTRAPPASPCGAGVALPLDAFDSCAPAIQPGAGGGGRNNVSNGGGNVSSGAGPGVGATPTPPSPSRGVIANTGTGGATGGGSAVANATVGSAASGSSASPTSVPVSVLAPAVVGGAVLLVGGAFALAAYRRAASARAERSGLTKPAFESANPAAGVSTWTRRVDPADGAVFYERADGVTAWALPEGAAVANDDQSSAAANNALHGAAESVAEAPTAASPTHWRRITDGTGADDDFFECVETGALEWLVPPGGVEVGRV